MTLDTYSHVAPGLQQAAAERFDEMLGTNHEKTDDVAKMSPQPDMFTPDSRDLATDSGI